MSKSSSLIDPRVEAIFKDWNVKFRLVKAYTLANASLVEGAQVREGAHIAQAGRVDEYAAQMDSGADFPPIVVTAAGIMVDGNTRKAAAERTGATTFPAYVITVGTTGECVMIGGALNQMGGQRLTASEAQVAAIAMMDNGFPDAEIARTLGRSANSVRGWRKEQTFARVSTAGALTEADSKHLSKPVKQAMSAVKHTAPLEAFITGSKDLKVTRDAASAVVKVIETATSDADAVLAVEKELATMTPTTGKNPRKTRVPASVTATRANLKLAATLLTQSSIKELDVDRNRELVESVRVLIANGFTVIDNVELPVSDAA